MSLDEEQLKQQIEEEARVSQMIEDYLKNHYEELAGQVDHWMTRHEQDLDMKFRDLHELKVRDVSYCGPHAGLSQLFEGFSREILTTWKGLELALLG